MQSCMGTWPLSTVREAVSTELRVRAYMSTLQLNTTEVDNRTKIACCNLTGNFDLGKHSFSIIVVLSHQKHWLRLRRMLQSLAIRRRHASQHGSCFIIRQGILIHGGPRMQDPATQTDAQPAEPHDMGKRSPFELAEITDS